MKLSVIIPCYNAAETIGVQLEALSGQQWSDSWEVVVSDNGSSDKSVAVVEGYRERLPNLRIVDSSDQQGRAHARNVGVLAASGDMLLFCDADDEVGPGWLAAMGEALSKYDFVACRVDFEKLNPPYLANNFRNHEQRSGLQKASFPPYLAHAGGGTLGVSRALHEAVGGFDESLPRMQDTDYCFRIQLAGRELHFVPGAIVHVRCREKLSSLFHQMRAWGEHSVLLCKRYGAPGMKISQPWKRHAREWVRLLQLLWRIRSKHALVEWISYLGWLVGVLQGSLKHRVAPV